MVIIDSDSWWLIHSLVYTVCVRIEPVDNSNKEHVLTVNTLKDLVHLPHSEHSVYLLLRSMGKEWIRKL